MLYDREAVNLLTAYKDRVYRIALFDVFHQLSRKVLRDQNDIPVDMFGMGLLSLLFFFEKKLSREKKQGVRELGFFLQTMTHHRLYASNEEYIDLARQIIDVMRPAGGKGIRYDYYDYEKDSEDTIILNILKADEFDSVLQLQYYTLDEQGLELIFATKEYFSEFQISISQMMLKKQLEKGQFHHALRQVEEMRINVQSIKENIHRIRHDIQRNITSEDTYTRYKRLIEDVNHRLSVEHEEFETLCTFVAETRSSYSAQAMTAGDDGLLNVLTRIDNELTAVHAQHAGLLKESIELKSTALDAAAESLYYAGVTSFNFEQEIVSKMVNLPIPLMETRRLAQPFLKRKVMRTWSPLAVFEPHYYDAKNAQIQRQAFLESAGVGMDERFIKRQEIFGTFMRLIIRVYRQLNQREMCVEELVKACENLHFESKFIDSREFVETFVRLHQMSPLIMKDVLNAPGHLFHKGAHPIVEHQVMHVKEGAKVIELGPHYSVNNMIIEMEERINE